MTGRRAGSGERRWVPLGFQVWAAVGVLLSLLAIVPVNGLESDEARLNGQDVPYASAVADAAFLS